MAFISGSGEQPKMQSVAWEDSSLQPCPVGPQPPSRSLSTAVNSVEEVNLPDRGGPSSRDGYTDSPGSSIEDDHNKVKETQARRVNGKPRRKFTKDELYLLNHTFEENPYPDFTIRKELAGQLCCQIYAIDNWFQNKRARLPLKERQRIFATRKLHLSSAQGHPYGSLQDPQDPTRAPEHTCSSTLAALPGGAGHLSPETQWVSSQQDGSGDTRVPGVEKELSYALGYQGNLGSGLYSNYPFYSYKPANSLPPTSVQYHEKYEPDTGQSWTSRAFVLHGVYSQQGERQQQQVYCPYALYSLYQGQQQNGC
ncbi:cytoplasmic polyadenylated homeobox-like isoform X1 [Canis lupus familiaris]|uniref:cytoplasmic polyadenylated homeobox-like isoform X1 n=2 Tax=Canis lupus familiaris TaxID=9615 RepID=UPI0006B3D060|nr:cytoplasmic polyadenylated homeobox-like isoform X1 [Canis lupus familiaris]|eukprot:XP_022273310.1 retinal homeobox protein Rx isoform X1 [Canis lupus familiaris]